MDSIREQGEVANEISEAIAGDQSLMDDVRFHFVLDERSITNYNARTS